MPRSRSITLAIAILLPSVLAFLNFIILPDHGSAESSIRQIMIPGGKLLQFALPLLCLCWIPDRNRQAHRPRWGLAVGTAFGAGVGGGIIALYYAVFQYSPLLQEMAAHLFAFLREVDLASREGFLILGIGTAVVHSFLEEYYWRWFVFGSLQRHSVRMALVLSTIGFTSYHVFLLVHYFPPAIVPVVVPITAAIAVGGWFWGWLYHQTNSLGAVWLSHLLVDAGLVFVEYQMLARFW